MEVIPSCGGCGSFPGVLALVATHGLSHTPLLTRNSPLGQPWTVDPFKELIQNHVRDCRKKKLLLLTSVAKWVTKILLQLHLHIVYAIYNHRESRKLYYLLTPQTSFGMKTHPLIWGEAVTFRIGEDCDSHVVPCIQILLIHLLQNSF